MCVMLIYLTLNESETYSMLMNRNERFCYLPTKPTKADNNTPGLNNFRIMRIE